MSDSAPSSQTLDWADELRFVHGELRFTGTFKTEYDEDTWDTCMHRCAFNVNE